MLYDLGGRTVIIEGDCFVAESASVIGSVRIGKNASVWFGAVVRADEGAIVIGENSNIQDGAVLHCDRENDLVIGRGVTVAHKAMLHGCMIGDDSLIGVGAIVLNGAIIGSNCLVGAGSLVLEGTVIPDDSLVLGSPAKAVRAITPAQTAEILHASDHYVRNAREFIERLKPRR